MVKPATLDGYSDQYTIDCERVLLTLLRGLGPWKESVYLVGGLTPRYLVRQRQPVVPAHAGTQDVDLVIDLQVITTQGSGRADFWSADRRLRLGPRVRSFAGRGLHWSQTRSPPASVFH
jgi:hypothetical protein